MIKVASSNTTYLKYLHLSQHDQIIHFVSTRIGGVSQAPGEGLNVGFHQYDQEKNVIRNREILAKTLDVSADSFCFMNQVHSAQVTVVTQKQRGSGVGNPSIAKTDAIVTQDKDVCLMALGADCVGVLFYDPVKKAIGAAHSGWRGTVKKVAAHTVQTMQTEFGSNPQDILVGLGPGISQEVYEVGQEVVDAVEQAFGSTFELIEYNQYTDKPHFNIWQAIENSLTTIGVPSKNIITSGLCSYRNPSLFYSHRRDKGKTGRQATGIMLK